MNELIRKLQEKARNWQMPEPVLAVEQQRPATVSVPCGNRPYSVEVARELEDRRRAERRRP